MQNKNTELVPRVIFTGSTPEVLVETGKTVLLYEKAFLYGVENIEYCQNISVRY